MEGKTSVKVLGFWSHPPSTSVELALKLKGISYEYFDEDIINPSELVHKYNPIHKQIPVLIHNEKPIVDPLIILEYVDDFWSSNAPKLLPQDPYKRAQSRFWASFVNQKVFESMLPIALSEGEAQEKTLEVFHHNLKLVEDGGGHLLAGGSIGDVNEHKLGLLDIVLHSVLGPYKSYEEALGLKFIDKQKIPLLFSWLNALNALPKISPLILQTHDERVSHLKEFRQMSLQKTSSLSRLCFRVLRSHSKAELMFPVLLFICCISSNDY